MAAISGRTLGKAFVAAALSAGVSVLIAGTVVPILGGSYDGIGMWLSLICPLVIAFPASAWQFHQTEVLRHARDELASLHVELDRMHRSLIQAHAILENKSRHDAMTGGLNRETFFRELDAASVKGRSGALLLADADNFKRINDSFGHQTGDEALIAISGAIAATIGLRDFWGRIGGEEFAIFLDGGDAGEAMAVAEAIRQRAENIEIRRELGLVPISLSLGGVCLIRNFNSAEAMSDADRRLYRAKRQGRNRVDFGAGAEHDDAPALTA